MTDKVFKDIILPRCFHRVGPLVQRGLARPCGVTGGLLTKVAGHCEKANPVGAVCDRPRANKVRPYGDGQEQWDMRRGRVARPGIAGGEMGAGIVGRCIAALSRAMLGPTFTFRPLRLHKGGLTGGVGPKAPSDEGAVSAAD